MDDMTAGVASDETLVAEVRSLSSEVTSLSADVKKLADVQEKRRIETLRIAEALRVETAVIAENQRLDQRHRTRVITGWLAALVIALVVFGAIVVNDLRDNEAAARDNEATISKAIAENNRRVCLMVSPFASRPGDAPPAGNPAQVRRALGIRKEFSEQLRDFGCN